MTTVKGVILQATYRVATQQGGRRVPVIHLYGRLEDGGTFLVRDNRQQPQFYIRSSDVERANSIANHRVATGETNSAVGYSRPTPTNKRDFGGSPVSRIGVAIPSDVPTIRDRLHASGIDTFEADVRFPVRYLIERGIKGACVIEGTAIPGSDEGSGVSHIFDNPQLTPA